MSGKSVIHGPNFLLELAAGAAKGRAIAGSDEAGRGPLAGPVVAAAVILPLTKAQAGLFDHLRDSKKMNTKAREQAFDLIQNTCDWAIAEASVAEIDRINILQASLLAMSRAVERLQQVPQLVLVDGRQTPRFEGNARPEAHCLIKGDNRSLSIAAASILAKVSRDRLMAKLDEKMPAYGWARNKGYPTAEHRQALKALGPSPYHRMSFAPVRHSAR